MKDIIIGTRGSVLALWQANFIRTKLEKKLQEQKISANVKLEIVKTKGDKILDVPLAKIGGKGLFTKELEELMLKKEIDLAVHSLKDVPVILPKGLCLCAITEREDVRDAFLSEKYANLDDLPKGAKIGTTSLRRTLQLKLIRPDLDTQSLRGNVQTRLKRLRDGEFSAIILATAGANRLQLAQNGEVKHIKPLNLIPAMGQAALGIEVRENSEIAEFCSFLNDPKSEIECECEREFVRVLEGGCQVPIGVNAELCNDFNELKLRAILGVPDGSKVLQDTISLKNSDSIKIDTKAAKNLGKELAEKFIQKGAKEILQIAQEWEF